MLSKGQIEPQKGWKTRGVSSPCAQAFYTIAAAIAHGRRREPALEASPKIEAGLKECQGATKQADLLQTARKGLRRKAACASIPRNRRNRKR